MSYSISLQENGKIVQLKEKHHIFGVNIRIGGSFDCKMDITYNYSKILKELFGHGGIINICGMTASESIPKLKEAISTLGDVVPDEDYWKPTKGNVKQLLEGLLFFAANVETDPVWRY